MVLPRNILCLASLLLSACELFAPRAAEPPGGEITPYSFKPPTTPELLLEDISIALPAFQADHLLKVLVEDSVAGESFRFLPDPSVAETSAGLFDDWGYLEEQDFLVALIQLLSPNGLQDFSWENTQVTTLSDQTEIQARYAVQLNFGPLRDNPPDALAGQAYLTLVRGEDQLYRVLVWQDEDLPNDSMPSWSALKAAL